MLHRSLGLFDQDTRHRKLEALGDPLVVLNKIVPWEMFREPLEAFAKRYDAQEPSQIDLAVPKLKKNFGKKDADGTSS